MGGEEGNSSELQEMLQSAVQAVQWTYSLFWRFCPHQGLLVWEDGYYNGAIKTRKTVQPMEVTAEEASLQRSQQLRELYDSLSAGESSQPPTRRPCASLSPEDLTESEWFYLMCVSFSFPNGVGLPGKAYAKCEHLWLTGANEVDSTVFSRAILAKSAHIQTIVCIPVMDGIVELGFTQKVEEDPSFIKQVKGFFNNHRQPPLPPPKPALSEHSTSNPGPHYASVYTSPLPPVTTGVEVDDDSEAEDEDDSEAETGLVDHLNPEPTPAIGLPQPELAEQSELMQIEMSEDIRVGSPEDVSNNIDTDNFEAIVGGLRPSHHIMHRVDSFESTRRWPNIQQQQQLLFNQQQQQLLFNSNDLQLPASGLTPIEDELSQEDTHYSQTVSIILHFQSSNPTSTTSSSPLSYPPNTAFTQWSPKLDHFPPEGTSQWLLKYILFTVPYMHTKFNTTTSLKSSLLGRDPPRGFRHNKGTPQDELSANHVLAERRRREKLNERFITLRTLVPFVTKMDKASILGDTIEYVKQLRKKIQELEAREHVRKARAMDGGETSTTRVTETPPATMTEMLQVSIIESDVLVELQCPYKEGLLLDVMLTLKDMRIEVKAIQSSFNNGWFVAELRGKVKENVNGKKVSIVEVKKAINQVVPHQHGDA